ncbi:uncharacterized protein [Symphalangus syndactylus]|uniref:uncharacterized protein n=1 Tax=Symphalangus syndactylus TaxID=9590 RepID=UPI0030056BE3
MHWRSRVRGVFGSGETAREPQWEPPGDPEDRIRGAARYLPTPLGPHSENQDQLYWGFTTGQERVLWIPLVRRAQPSDRVHACHPGGAPGAGRSGGRSLVGGARSLRSAAATRAAIGPLRRLAAATREV